MWQELSGRGCYFDKSEGIWCDKVQGNDDVAKAEKAVCNYEF